MQHKSGQKAKESVRMGLCPALIRSDILHVHHLLSHPGRRRIVDLEIHLACSSR